MSYKINLEGKKEGDVLAEKECSACGTMMIKKAIPDTYKGGVKASSYLDETGQAHLRMEGVGNFICKKTGQSISGKTQKTITDDPNNTSKIHVDSHSHADMMKSIQEVKDMLISMKSALATFMEREK